MSKETHINIKMVQRMRDDGKTWDEIGERFGCTGSTACKLYQQAIKDNEPYDLTVDEYRGIIANLICNYIDWLATNKDTKSVDVMHKFEAYFHDFNFELFPMEKEKKNENS